MARSEAGHVERAAGKRAPFKVIYRRRGFKRGLYWDAIWAPGTDEAAAKFKAFAKELGWVVEVVRVERIDSE